jgi:transcriptional regulator with XRE-family HTH domain
MSNLSERLALLASRYGSPLAFAKALEIPNTTVYQYIRGDRRPSDAFLVALARLRISPLWVLTGEGPMLLEDAGQNEPPAAPVDPDLLRIQSALTTWWSSADDDERAWLKVQLRKHLPEVFKPQK